MATKKRKGNEQLQVRGSLWLSVGGESVAGHGRIELLRAVNEHRSITQAAKAFGMSYKAAWDAINTMNERSTSPVVERVTGGKGGGHTQVTAFGLRLIERYEQVHEVHRRFLHLIEQEAMNLDEEFSLLKVLNMKTSARNQWVGKVTAVRSGAVNDEVEVSLPGGLRLSAIVTRESTESLGLRTQMTVIALVKSSAVLLAVGLDDARVSARNRIEARVQKVTPGAVNAEVVLQAEGGVDVVAIVPQPAVHELGLQQGAAVTALVKASDIVLAVAN
ncbi:TOBE domain-containing protein [Hydrogenophaga laconesensis]|uniref:Molybdate transport system regulatory protein n=1 Tax=Hydrogenophaga laconesensis TaxID=1805971 RepID=A0ABU1VC29_9BURK|nr:TOBE domain-containing protein [Hydrogenophaga laconesensis]MDR7094895.1 molybdate transport system regulatory protein [Hydrogenophaga laconesensis]